MNNSNKISHFLTMKQADAIMAAASHAFCIKHPLNLSVTVHLNQAGVSSTHAFVTAFFKLTGDWLRARTKMPPVYVWALENEQNKGLHLHALVHVPVDLQMTFRTLARRWIRHLGHHPTRNTLKIKMVDGMPNRPYFANPREIMGYLGVWGGNRQRHGLKGALSYMLKGLSKADCNKLGIGHAPQGVVTGKRCGFSEALGPTRRNRQEPTWRRPHPRCVRISIRGPELWRRRFLFHAGFLLWTDYEPTK